jgi:hypothetical protein
LIETAKFKEP